MKLSVNLCMGQCNCEGNQQDHFIAKAKLAVFSGARTWSLYVVSPDFSFYEMDFLHMHS